MMTMKQTRFASGKLALAMAAVLFGAPAFGQTPAVPATTGSLHGTVTDPTGLPLMKGEVRFTTNTAAAAAEDKTLKYDYVFPVDASGNYVAKDIKPADYYVIVFQEGKHLDYQDVPIKAGDDKAVNFDMTREEYMKELPPEKRKEIEEVRKKNSEALSVNKVVVNLNATLARVRADLAAATANRDDVSHDVSDMQSATQAKPDESILWFVYGDTLQAQGDHLAKADRATGKAPMTDDDVLKNYSDAGDAFKKSADLNAASKKPDANTQSSAYNQIGLLLAKSGKLPEASAALETAVKLEPANAGMYYGNEAAILFNSNQTEASLAAAEKAIAADPKRADPYFIKGQALIGNSTVDPKTQKPVAPPGCIEAYQMYLELDPDGKQAATVKEILGGFDVKIDTKYKAGKKN